MRILFVSLGIVIADQLTKLMIKGAEIPWLGIHFKGVPLGSSRPIIGDLLRLTYIENPGMAFGIDLGGKLFFSIVSIVASIGIVLYLYKMREESLPYRLSLSMILGGAVGNLIDRTFYGVFFDEAALFHGRVVDFIDADFFNVNVLGLHLNRWPVFNIADAAVTCGVILLLLVHRKATASEGEPSPIDGAGAGLVPGTPDAASTSFQSPTSDPT